MPATMKDTSKDCHTTKEADVLEEGTPLIEAIPTPFVKTMWAAGSLGVLVILWCIVDSWNHDSNLQFMELSMVQAYAMPDSQANLHHGSPLMLAYMQLAFMSVCFLVAWLAFTKTPHADLSELKDDIRDTRWPVMAATHVFSTFWLQAMIMPTQLMSLAVFAASRAAEVPATALLRSQVIGGSAHIQSPVTSGLMFLATWTMFYSYSSIAECLCVWSGHGVELSGVALYVIYALVLVLPAANAVCQEAVMVQYRTPTFLILAVQNILACMICIPFMILAHCVGWENVPFAARMITSSPSMIMTVLWLCVQMTLLSGVGMGILCMVDSFWAMAFRGFRVVFWWCKELILFYFMNKVSLSVARPHASFWSLVMLWGVFAAFGAMVIDYRGIEKRGAGKTTK